MTLAMATALELALALAREQPEPNHTTVQSDPRMSQDELDQKEDQETEDIMFLQEADKRCPIPLDLWAAA